MGIITLSEEAMQYLEEQIPALAELAIRKAYLDALAAGFSVVIAEEGRLIEVFPDGSCVFIKEIEKPEPVVQKQFTLTRP